MTQYSITIQGNKRQFHYELDWLPLDMMGAMLMVNTIVLLAHVFDKLLGGII